MNTHNKHWKYLLIIISIILFSVTNLFAGKLYDLYYYGEPLRDGKYLFVRLRNALGDPILRTLEINLYDPYTGKITILQQYSEKMYILPVVSRDRSTIAYHSLIESNDFLITRNIESGSSTRLRFDTSGYFMMNAISYDNEKVASVLKRGENRQAIYIISTTKGSIRRLFSGTDFQEIGFFNNGSIYYIDRVAQRLVLGVVRSDGKGRTVVAHGIDYAEKLPNGDALLYSVGLDLFLYRVNTNESIRLSRNFSPSYLKPLIAEDGSTCAVREQNRILLVNIPSGDILYYLSFETTGTRGFLTRFTFYITKDSRIFHIKHKKPGQHLTEAHRSEGIISSIAASPDDRYILYQLGNERELKIYDREKKNLFSKEFTFSIQDFTVSPYMDPSEAMSSIYLEALSTIQDAEGNEGNPVPLRELYVYDFLMKALTAVSTSGDIDPGPYLREE
jgi:Tol biopolymer transport system component